MAELQLQVEVEEVHHLLEEAAAEGQQQQQHHHHHLVGEEAGEEEQHWVGRVEEAQASRVLEVVEEEP